jgi:hypothetical protein
MIAVSSSECMDGEVDGRMQPTNIMMVKQSGEKRRVSIMFIPLSHLVIFYSKIEDDRGVYKKILQSIGLQDLGHA